MPTVRTQPQLQAVWPDNDVGEISAADGRDMLATFYGFAAPRDPTPDDDSVNSGGSGQYFDLGNVWLNTTTQHEFRCYSGAAHMAIWQKIPQVPGMPPITYGDNSHYPVFTLDNDGMISFVTLYPVTSNPGTVTSVDQTAPADLLLATGGPITTAGTLALNKAAVANPNYFYASPVGGAGLPVFRAIDASDLAGASAGVWGITDVDYTDFLAIGPSGTREINGPTIPPNTHIHVCLVRITQAWTNPAGTFVTLEMGYAGGAPPTSPLALEGCYFARVNVQGVLDSTAITGASQYEDYPPAGANQQFMHPNPAGWQMKCKVVLPNPSDVLTTGHLRFAWFYSHPPL